MGHVIALKPRVKTQFPQGNFLQAKQYLEEESYATIEEAARAVCEKALELTRDGGKNRGFGGKGRR